ncbi:hypothetical protein BHM03_00005739 [Ensete ventricosum]|nr:hypothetical protein BHM03_00005739 [Ensete ventricosum]
MAFDSFFNARGWGVEEEAREAMAEERYGVRFFPVWFQSGIMELPLASARRGPTIFLISLTWHHPREKGTVSAVRRQDSSASLVKQMRRGILFESAARSFRVLLLLPALHGSSRWERERDEFGFQEARGKVGFNASALLLLPCIVQEEEVISEKRPIRYWGLSPRSASIVVVGGGRR